MLCLLLVGALLIQIRADNDASAQSDGCPAENTPAEGGALARFRARKSNEGFFLLPVNVSGRQFNAAIDTGSAYTIFDASLRPLLDEPLSQTTLRSPSGKVQLEAFRSPEIWVAGLPRLVPKNGVLAPDLAWCQRQNREAFQVMLGMDVLDSFVLQIDGTRGEVAFLKQASGTNSKPVRLRRVGGTPWVLGMMGAHNGAWFQLDTASIGPIDGHLSRQGFADVSSAGLFNIEGFAIGLSVSGASTVRRGRLIIPLTIGDYELPRATLMEAEYCSLGVDFLNRLVTTFDFPNSLVYFDVPRPDAHSKRSLDSQGPEVQKHSRSSLRRAPTTYARGTNSAWQFSPATVDSARGGPGTP